MPPHLRKADYERGGLSFVESPADSQVIQGCQFFQDFDEQQLEYVLLADGESEDVYMVGKIAAFQIQSLLVAYKERFDKDNFIKIFCWIIFFWSIFTTGQKITY